MLQRVPYLESITESSREENSTLDESLSDDALGPQNDTVSGCAWQENVSNCAICNSSLSKRRLNPRHHCRICGRCVCSACSPSTLQLDGFKGLQRACTPCVRDAQSIPVMKTRLNRLGQQLHCLAGTRRRAFTIGALEDVVVICEEATQPLEDLYDKHKAIEVQAEKDRAFAKQQLAEAEKAKADARQQCAKAEAERESRKQQEVRINAAQGFVVDLHKRLYAVLGDGQNLPTASASLEETLTLCEALLLHAEVKAQDEAQCRLREESEAAAHAEAPSDLATKHAQTSDCRSMTNPTDSAQQPREQTCIRRCSIM